MLTLNLWDSFSNGVVAFFLWIDSAVYWVLSIIFGLFEQLAKAEILKISE